MFAHLLTLFSLDAPETKEHISSLIQIITASGAQPAVKYRVYDRYFHLSMFLEDFDSFDRLSNLFNALPHRSGLRLSVNEALLQVASANDELEQLQISEGEVERWLSEWDINFEEKSSYLKQLADAYAQNGNQYVPYILSLLQSAHYLQQRNSL